MDMKMKAIIMLSTYVLLVDSCDKQNSREHERHSVQPIYNNYHNTYGGRYTYDKGNVGTHVEGGVGLDGNWHVGVGFKVKLEKREAQWVTNGNRYNVTIHIDPCFFLSYDLNRNGEFAKDELLTIFGKDEKANALFSDLDTEPGDGVITEEEFYTKAPFIIADCFNKES